MSMTPVTCPKEPLTRDLDVVVNISRPISEIATDMTMLCFATPSVTFSDGGNDRVRFYSTMDALSRDVLVNTPAYWAGTAFFSRSERPTTMCVGRVFTEPTPAVLKGGTIPLTTLKSVTDGSFTITVNDTEHSVTGLDFSGDDTLLDVAATIASKITGIQVLVFDSGLMMRTSTAGDGMAISYASASVPATGTDVSSLLGWSQATAVSNTIGYNPGDLVSELNLIAKAARCAGRAVYGWVLDAQYRDTPDQKSVADWAEARKPAYFSACTNSPQAYNTSDESNIGAYVSNKGYRRTSVMYHNNPQVYPDMSYLALALSVDYAQDNSTLTMKFKQLSGIEPSPLDESQLSALESRRVNSYVAIGNTSRETREGVQGDASWYTDSLVNLDNFAEELQVEVYNVFLRNKKVPYTNGGQNLLVSAATKICKRYTSNGTFADRDVETNNNETGFETLPATDIRPAPISGATVSDRAKRLAPPIAITAYEAGAFHKVVLNVGVFS